MKGASITSFLLFVLEMTWILESQVAGQPKGHVQCSKSCTTFSKKIPPKLLKTYKKTEPACRKAAIIFVTKMSKEFCADPDAHWVKEAIQQLDEISLDAPESPLATTVTSVTVQEGAGVFHRLFGGTVSSPAKASAPANPIHGTTISQAVHVSFPMTEEASKSTLPVQEDTRSSTLQEIVTPPTISPEPLPNGNEASITVITTPTAEVPGSISSIFNSDPISVTKRSESVIESTKKSTGSTINPSTDIPGTVPNQFNSDPVPFIKGLESTVHATYKSVGSGRNQTADVLGPASRRFTSAAPSIVNDTEIAELFPTIPALLESVPSKSVVGLASMGQVTENPTMTPTAVLKGSGSPLPSTSAGGESHSVSMNGGDKREAVRDSTARAHVTNYLSPLGTKDPAHSFPESISPPETSGLSTESVLLWNIAGTASESPDVHLEPAPHVLSQTHILSLILLTSILCFCSVMVGLYVKFKVCSGESPKEVAQALLFNQQASRTDEYAMEVI